MHESWDDMAEWYDGVVDAMEPEFSKATEAMLDAAHLKEDQSLLDLACGPGHTSAAAAKRGAKTLGIDLSQEMVTIAKRRFPACAFETGNMLQPPAGPWDAIVCRFGVHHVEPAWAQAAYDALAPGGRISIAEFDATNHDAHANGMRGASHWEDLLSKAGFSNVKLARMKLDFSAYEHQKVPAPSENVLILSGQK